MICAEQRLQPQSKPILTQALNRIVHDCDLTFTLPFLLLRYIRTEGNAVAC
jgi:hypothetical protein